MRKVKNNISTGNPAVMFAQGLESLIADPLHQPAQFDHEAIDQMKHRANKQDARGNLFNSLFRQFANL